MRAKYPARDAPAMAAQMIRLAQDHALTARLGAGARLTAESLSWELEYDRLDLSYRELLDAPRAPSEAAMSDADAQMARA